MAPLARRRWLLHLGAVGATGLTGCAALLPPVVDTARPYAAATRRVELEAVAFYPQDDYQCGPAALATVLQHAGVPRTPQQLVDQVYVPQRKGSFQPEMLAATRRAGLLAYPLAPTPEALLAEVEAGRPVLVLQNLRWDWAPVWHYAVVVGYDMDDGTVVLRSGLERRLVMPVADFERTWLRASRWAFVALPAGQLPARPNEAGYVAAAAALERVVPAAGVRAYETALEAWPRNLFARMALGNAAYRQHQLPQAEAAYRQAASDHPDAADAWNNLAQVLHERQQPAQALEAAQRAVALGGPRLATYEATRAAILATKP